MDRRNFLKGFLASATVVALAPLAPAIELSLADAEFLTFEEIAQEVLKHFRGQLIANITGQDIFCNYAKPIIMTEEQMENYFTNEPYKKSELMIIR